MLTVCSILYRPHEGHFETTVQAISRYLGSVGNSLCIDIEYGVHLYPEIDLSKYST